jgi:hypothetical protein
MLAFATWLMWLVAVAMFAVILMVGVSFLRGVSGDRPVEIIEPEDVESLDVLFVCAECGTEYRITRIGEIQVPRHCGEPMMIVRRPRADPANN